MFALLFCIFFILIFYFIFFISTKNALPFVSKKIIGSLLTVKIIAGFSYIYINKNVISAGDIFSYFEDSKIIYGALQKGECINYLHLTFGLNNGDKHTAIYPYIEQMGFWFDTPSYLLVRLNAIINIFTQGQSIYLNSIFFSIISAFGCLILSIFFYRFLKVKSNWIVFIIFLFPGNLFWLTGMHKESISIFLLAIVLLSFVQLLHKIQMKYIVAFILSNLFLLLLRQYIVLLMAPPLLAYALWYFTRKYRPILVFTTIYILLFVVCIGFPTLVNKPTAIDFIMNKKNQFEALDNGNTAITLGHYKGTSFGIIQQIPTAFFNAVVRPHFKDIHSAPLFIASSESFIISLMLFISLFYIKNLNKKNRAMILLLYAFSLSYLILIGLIVPNIGAILRYRSVAMFILVPTMAYIIQQKNKLNF